MMAGWKKYIFSDFLKRSKISILLEDEKVYKRVTIRTKHGGVSVRNTEHGSKIGTKKQFLLKSGQFVLSKIDARYGAFGIAPEEVDNAIITGNFWAYDFDEKVISIHWLNNFTNSSLFYDICERASSGITYRKYLNEQVFLNSEIYLPDIDEQEKVLSLFEQRYRIGSEVSQELSHQQTMLKKLRQQILQEAIEGKLTEDWRAQNPDVEPACELLKRIQEEKCQLIKDKKIKKQKPLPGDLPAGRQVSEDEKPFELPEGWVWCRVGTLLNKFSTGPFGSMLHKSDYVPNGIPLVNPANIIDETIVPSQKMMIDQETRKRLSKYILQDGEFVIARRGDLSKCAIVTKQEKGWLCGTGSFFIQPSSFISKKYFIKVYKSYFFQQQLTANSVGQTMANLNQKILNGSIFPLPPFHEQKAIVAKVENLLAVCDQLEKQITRNQNYANALMQAVLKEAFTSSKGQIGDQIKQAATHA